MTRNCQTFGFRHRSAGRGAVVALAMLLFATNGTCEEIELKDLVVRLVDDVEVPARAIGALSKITVKEGSVVTKGQLLGQIDDTESRLELERAKLETEIASRESRDDVAVRSALKSLRYATAEFQRLQRAKEDQFAAVSESELEKAQLDAEHAQLEIEKGKSELATAGVRLSLSRSKQQLAQRAVDVRQILAPQNGVVLEIKHQAGEWVTPGETIFRVVDTKRLRIEGFVSALKLEGIRQGQSVVVRPVGSPKSIEGTITFLSPEVDLAGKALVVAEISNEGGEVRPGTRADMILSKKSK
ncbi:MAG: HlyD family efflux transporter periplasmic adaptor subunit [Planctomycetota bacterium]